MQNYIFTQATNDTDLQQLVKLFNEVFSPEKVGELAEVLTRHLPHMHYENWFIAQDKSSQEIVSGFVLIPWHWNLQGIDLKVAEMGIVGTAEHHRNKGLFKQTNVSFQQHLLADDYDLSVIQGIPGIYHRLGYHYAVPLEHHTELPLYAIPDTQLPISVRLANETDIPFLCTAAERQQKVLDMHVKRTKAHWRYILGEGKHTEYASDLYIIDNGTEQHYLRLLQQGFGQGLIVSEASCDMSSDVLECVLSFLKKEAIKRGKPYIRLNLPNSHCLVQHAVNYQACLKPAYAWQVKIVNPQSFLSKLRPLLEQRIRSSKYSGLSACVMLDFYTQKVVLHFKNGLVQQVSNKSDDSPDYVMSIPDDLFAPLVLGHRSWRELQYNRPDIFPADQYLRMDTTKPAEITGELMDILFPKLDSWIYGQY